MVAEVLPLLPSSRVYPLHPSRPLTAHCSFIVHSTMHGGDREPEISPLPGGGGWSVMTHLLACFVPLEKLKRPD